MFPFPPRSAAETAASCTAVPSEASPSLAGSLLVASPALAEGPFARSVIFLCAHSPGRGAMGLVVNRRLSQPGLDDVLAQLGIDPVPPRRRIDLCAGGPVDEARGFVLHSSDWTGAGSLPVDDGTTLTASQDVLKDIADGAGPRRALLALGHASWQDDQLEDEIIHRNAWLPAPASDAILFGGGHSLKWRQALAAINLDPMQLTAATGHA
ncbi:MULTISPECIES: YqgE/AlgH family protein [Nguyenibacter]|uniref:YqgE/AlgH family protein n=1 Tax=Nguyenibacter TaxID=1519186 RepID=UPI0038D204C6